MSLSFSELEKELQETPATWCPALLRTLVQTALRRNVFKEPDGLVFFITNTKSDFQAGIKP